MPGTFQYFVWFLCTLLEVSVVVCSIAKGSFRRYLSLNVYMLAASLANIGRFKIFYTYGLNSPEYGYFYYYSDLLLTIGLYFALMGLYSYVFEEMGAEHYVRMGALLLLLGTAGFSFAIVQQSSSKILGHFVVEASQNLYFVGWSDLCLVGSDAQATRNTHALDSVGSRSWTLFQRFCCLLCLAQSLYGAQQHLAIPHSHIRLPLASGWAYAFWRIPEDARIAPSRLAVVPR